MKSPNGKFYAWRMGLKAGCEVAIMKDYKLKILLTGSTGMVGKNFLEHPKCLEYCIIAPSRQELNLLDYGSVEKYIRHHKPDFIIHAAGLVGGIQANIERPVDFLIDNLDMGRNLIGASLQAGIKQVINIGSSCMYPRNREEALTEDMVLCGQLEPTNEGYALAKVTITRLCQYITAQYPGFFYKTLIPSNLYGRWDKFGQTNSHLVPAIIDKLHRAVVNKQTEVVIWGDGAARREFLYVGDFADCLHRAIAKFDTLPMLMNVGLGYDYSVYDYYRAVANVVGYTGEFVYDLTKPVGMARKLVNISKAESWGWHSRSKMEEGLRKTYAYYLKHVFND
ncbi:MAG: NAD-dependent epimerase/dehydratase [Firmicutes bacterium]|nr:NAD-dependent epimerase/dehydratase [Bacillota bacterium]